MVGSRPSGALRTTTAGRDSIPSPSTAESSWRSKRKTGNRWRRLSPAYWLLLGKGFNMAQFRSLASRIFALFQRRAWNQRVDEEVQFHLEMQTEENIRCGLNQQAARGRPPNVREHNPRQGRGTSLEHNFV